MTDSKEKKETRFFLIEERGKKIKYKTPKNHNFTRLFLLLMAWEYP